MKTPFRPLTEREHSLLWRIVEAAAQDPSIPLDTGNFTANDKRTAVRLLRKLDRPEDPARWA